MRVRKDFILRNVGGERVVVAVGKASRRFDGIIMLNESGEILWRELQKGATEKTLVSALLSEYNIDEKTARADVEAFVKKLSDAGAIV
ncbi:MAG: PqqD family protein [Ruminococcus sp.]|nr:PqqD family protein [Ruminococcus sp.]MBR4622789.1 PqqD family protein [Ruminococcus sp.]